MNTNSPYVIGLTGSIGMGKSTTAKMFGDLGIAVWDADAVVHQLYQKGGAAVAPIESIRPEAVIDGAVSRSKLKSWISEDVSAIGKIEMIVHPLVALHRQKFLKAIDTDIAVLEIPLLLENGGNNFVDMLVVVSVPAHIQRSRVLARDGMTEEHLDMILAKQLPDKEKRALADVVISTETIEGTRLAVQKLVQKIRKELRNA